MNVTRHLDGVILKLVMLLYIVAVVIAVMQGNADAAFALLTATFLAHGWLKEMSMVDAANEDARFWMSEYMKAQERYARAIPEPDEPCQSKLDEERRMHECDKM